MARIANLTFACSDPAGLARFWAAALGYEVEVLPPDVAAALRDSGLDPDDAASASDPERRGPRLFFERKLATRGRDAPIHLDIRSDDPAGEVARLEELGATHVERRERTIGDHTMVWHVMRDPEGNGFCVEV